jgi:hypothetical protein
MNKNSNARKLRAATQIAMLAAQFGGFPPGTETNLGRVSEPYDPRTPKPKRRDFTPTEQTVLEQLDLDKSTQGRKKYKAYRKELEARVYEDT